MSLKNQFITWRLKRKLASIKRSITPINLAKVKTAGIIWEIEDQDVFKMLVSQLKEQGVLVRSLCFSDIHGSVHGEVMFSPQDFSFFGNIKNREMNDFMDRRFDLLIDISLAKSLEVRYVRALSRASFKVGWSPVQPDYLDLSIDVSHRKEPSYLVEQILHYLSEINK
ncbi:MAG TPA: hypothetical protein VKA27_14025 [Sunxiuqinia sp.]|nr:hypothetical protein [Sunxiuqinia sp.]